MVTTSSCGRSLLHDTMVHGGLDILDDDENAAGNAVPGRSGKVCAALPGSATGPGVVADRADVADRSTPAVMRARTGPPSWPPNQR
jgi:hypothetical protein